MTRVHQVSATNERKKCVVSAFFRTNNELSITRRERDTLRERGRKRDRQQDRERKKEREGEKEKREEERKRGVQHFDRLSATTWTYFTIEYS